VPLTLDSLFWPAARGLVMRPVNTTTHRPPSNAPFGVPLFVDVRTSFGFCPLLSLTHLCPSLHRSYRQVVDFFNHPINPNETVLVSLSGQFALPSFTRFRLSGLRTRGRRFLCLQAVPRSSARAPSSPWAVCLAPTTPLE
jgi:hypothetical protein